MHTALYSHRVWELVFSGIITQAPRFLAEPLKGFMAGCSKTTVGGLPMDGPCISIAAQCF